MSILNIFSLLGGLGLFLYGMKLMSDSMEKAAGDKLRKILSMLTNNRFYGVLVGLVVTSIIQSSSATTVMVVSFVNSGMMTLLQAAGVIMGANIGTTITGQLVALNLSSVAPIILFVGVVFTMFGKNKFFHAMGELITGFGILFVGLSMMSSAMKPLGEMESFRNFLVNFQNPLMGVLAGTIFTGIIQSSSASIGILQALALQGLIGLDTAVYVILGQNIGTCVTAMLACIGTNRTAKRAAMIHLLFNIIGASVFLLALNFIPIVPWIVSLTSNSASQIAQFHTFFNVVMTLLLFPFTNMLVSLSKLIIPGEDPAHESLQLKYIDGRLLKMPAMALEQLFNEVNRMSDIASQNFQLAIQTFFNFDQNSVGKGKELEDVTNFLYHEITKYLVDMQGITLPQQDLAIIASMHGVVSDIERVGDHAENIMEYASIVHENKVAFSFEALKELRLMCDKVEELLALSLSILKAWNTEQVNQVDALERAVDNMEKELKENHLRRLSKKECIPRAGLLFTDMIVDLERVGDHATNIAYSVRD